MACSEDSFQGVLVDAKDLASRITALPSDLTVWFDGPAVVPRLLAACTLRRFTELATNLREAGGGAIPDEVRDASRQRWRHAVSSLIEWHSVHGHADSGLVPMSAPPPGSRQAAPHRSRRRAPMRRLGKRDYDAAVDLGLAWSALDPIRVGLASGDMHVSRAQGKHVWVTNSRRAEIEALDVLLAQVTVFEPPTPDRESHVIDAWFKTNSGLGATGELLNSMPPRVREIAWRDTEMLLDVQGLSLRDTTDLGGLTLAQARTCYAYLIMQLRLNELAAFHFRSPETLVWGVRPVNLHRVLSSRVEATVASAFIDLLKYERGRSPVSAPLIPHHEMLLIPAELVSPIAFERTLLRAASANPSTAGVLGNTLGRRASRWVERLRTIPGCRVATELQVKSTDGRLLGDLDVVAWDPRRRQMVIVETKWPVDAATLSESGKVDATIDKGRAQLARLRAQIGDGSGTVAWPRDWHGAADTPASWWVGTAQQLDSRGLFNAEGVSSTSLRLVEHLLPAEDLDDLVARLSSLPLPRLGVEYALESTAVQAGILAIHFKALALLGDPPVPPADRRTQNGWT